MVRSATLYMAVTCVLLIVCPVFAHRTRTERVQTTPRYDVIIVGAGLSGLTAATRLKELDQNVLVLEASNRVGGRMLSIQNSNVGYVDLGAAYIDASHKKMLQQLAKYNLKTYATLDAAAYSSLCYRGGRVIKYKDSPDFPTVKDEKDYENLTNTMEKLMKQVQQNESYGIPLDQITFQQFLDANSKSVLVKGNVKMWSRADFCTEPGNVSLLWALNTLDSAGGDLEDLNSLERSDPVYLCVGGVQQLPSAMAAKLGGRVLFGEVVQGIQSDGSTATVTTAKGNTFKAWSVIIAIPPNAQKRITLNPPPSIERQKLIQNMPMGSVIKTFVYYQRAYWKEQGLSGYTTCEDDNCVICMSMDYTKPDGTYPALVGFISSLKAIQMSQLTKAQRRVQVVEHYKMMFKNIPAMNNPIYYEDYNWITDPWAQGGYSATMNTGILTRYADFLAKREGLVYYAGTEAAYVNDGYMDGAIHAGNRAANQVWDDSRKKKAKTNKFLGKLKRVLERKESHRHSRSRRA